MEEAKYSINVRFNLRGYDSQITLRDDENCGLLMEKYLKVLGNLHDIGATPARRWEEVKGNGNGNGKTEPPAAEQPRLENGIPPTCQYCGESKFMELIEFEKDGKHRKAWKCQGCEKWHYDKNGKK